MSREVAQRYQDNLVDIKKNVEAWDGYFKENRDRWYKFRRFAFITALTENDRAILAELDKPELEFNICEAFISRLRGEFSKQQPSINVSSNADTKISPEILEMVEGYIRYIEDESRKNGVAYDIYTDLLSGGFSVGKVLTKYKNEMSFDQDIVFTRSFDPTMCGFDPLAQEVHKGDGRFSFELFPKTLDEAKQKYPHVDWDGINFDRQEDGFNWYYKNQKEKIVIFCDYYQKKEKTFKIVRTADGQTMSMDDYEKMVQEWSDITQPPAIVGEPRTTTKDIICRYVFIKDCVLEYEETDFRYLPHVFFDGNSTTDRKQSICYVEQVTRPYIYGMEGLQRLRNFAGQTQANYLENMVQSKFKMPKEGIPVEFADNWTSPQRASLLPYNQYIDNDPNRPLNVPQEVIPVPMPPEVSATFAMTDQMAQSTLGSYDAALGINNNELSGIAIVEAATQSNAAAMPYVVSYMRGLNRVAEIIMDLMPKYMKSERLLPTISRNGKNKPVSINSGYSPSPDLKPLHTKFDSIFMDVKVEAGVNFEVEKNRTLQTMVALMQASPLFAQFMNQEGLDILLDNLNVRNVEALKASAQLFMQQLKQQQAQAAKAQQNQGNPLVEKVKLEQMKVQAMVQDNKMKSQLKAAEIQIDKQNTDNDYLRILLEAKDDHFQQQVQQDKADAEKMRATADMATKHIDMTHRHKMDHLHLAHGVAQTMIDKDANENMNNNIDKNV